MASVSKAAVTEAMQTADILISPRDGSPPFVRRRALVIAVLLLVLITSMRIYRASIENSLSVDETFSLMVVTHSLPDVIELTRVDQHPPGFYLVLKTWNWLGAALGIRPSVLWARLPSVASSVLLAIVAVWYAVRWLCLVEAVVIVTCVCLGSAAADTARSAGIYAIPFAALFAMFAVLISELNQAAADRTGSATRRTLRIAIYVLCGAAALYVHLLSGVVVALLATAWFGACWFRPNKRRNFTRAVLAQALIALLFLPWAIRISGQLAAFHSDPRAWTTPASFSNLLKVFTIWYPYGSLGEVTDWVRPWHTALGAASFAVPLVFAGIAWAAKFRVRGTQGQSAIKLISVLGLSVAICNVLLLWGLERFGLAHTWHGPRYPVFTASMWAAGLTATALHATHRLHWSPWVAALVMLPWLACNALGQAWGIRLENSGGLANWKNEIPNFPKPGDVVFAMPSELIPYHHAVLNPLHARNIEQLFDNDVTTSDVAVLNLNPWPGTDKLSNVFVRAAINGGTLSEHLEQRKIRDNVLGYTLHWLRGYRKDIAEQLRAYKLAPPPPPIPPTAVARALNEDQRLSDGWSSLNATTSLYTTRFALPPVAHLRFDRAVSAGKYRLFFVGQYAASLGSVGQITIRPIGEEASYQFYTATGPVSIKAEIQLSNNHDPLILDVAPPQPKASAQKLPPQNRPALHFFFAWLEKA